MIAHGALAHAHESHSLAVSIELTLDPCFAIDMSWRVPSPVSYEELNYRDQIEKDLVAPIKS